MRGKAVLLLGLAVSFMAVSCGREGAQIAVGNEQTVMETGDENRSDFALDSSEDEIGEKSNSTEGEAGDKADSTEKAGDNTNSSEGEAGDKADSTVKAGDNTNSSEGKAGEKADSTEKAGDNTNSSEEEASEKSDTPQGQSDGNSSDQNKSDTTSKSGDVQNGDSSESGDNSDREEYHSEKITEMKEVRYIKMPVYIRRLPDTDAKILGDYAPGQKIEATGLTDNGWYRIQYEGETAYLYGEYVCLTPEEVNGQPESPVTGQPGDSLAGQPENPVTGQPENPSTGITGDQAAIISGETDGVTDEQTNQQRLDRVMEIINTKRAENGLSELTTTPELMTAAATRAAEIVQSFSHSRPDGSSCFTALSDQSIVYLCAGENIAAGQQTADDVMNSWMSSSGHKANILNANFAHVGIGCYVCEEGYGIYWVQLFTD